MSIATRELTHLDELESEAIHIMREVAAEFERPALLFSGGKDSIVMLHLARKAFHPATPPFPVVPFTWVPGIVWFFLKALFVFFMFAMVKAFVPRYRYDQLMRLGWKVFLPISLAMVAIVAGVLQVAGWAPK